MRRTIIFTALALAGSAAQAQTSTTDCTSYIPNNVQCTTTTQQQSGINWGLIQQQQMQQQQQQQQQLNQTFQNLGAAVAARRERKRQELEAQKLALQQKAVEDSIKTARESDTAAAPPPADEKPVMLVCNTANQSATVALYEKHGRVDTTWEGVTHTRTATFTGDVISWNTPIARTSINRLDGSYIAVATLPALQGQTVSGSCNVAAERKF